MRHAESLARRVARASAVVWAVAVLALASWTVLLEHRGTELTLDAFHSGLTSSAYSLAHFDEDGRFVGRYLDEEVADLGSAVRVTVATRDAVLYGAREPGHAPLIERALAAPETEQVVEAADERTMALGVYDAQQQLAGVVIVTIPTGEFDDAVIETAALTAVLALLLIGLGLAMSQRLARRTLTALSASIAERERILAGAAHSLRTPVATVLAQVDASGPDEAEQTLREVRETMAEAGELVDRLLTWSRLAYDRPAKERLRLDLLVELCVLDDEPFDGEATVVEGDPRLIEVAVRDLLHNARVHGGGITRVHVAEGRVEIFDNGPGIATDEVLAPFVKGAGSPGTGLGLAIVSRIAEVHGGALELRPVVALALPS